MADEILGDYQHVIDEFKFVTGTSGAYEVKFNDDLVYSKKSNKRHAEEGEIYKLFQEYVGADTPKYSE